MNTIRPHFDWTINLGHILTIVALLLAGFLAYLSIELRVAVIDKRTVDYPVVRDQVMANAVEIRTLRELVHTNADNTRVILQTMTIIREDVASIKATIGRPDR